MSLTNMGKIFIVVMIALLFAGLNTKSNLLHLFNSFLICLWLLSPIMAQRNNKDFVIKIETPEEVFSNQSCPVQFFFENTSIYHKYALSFNDPNSDKTFCIAQLPAKSKSASTMDYSFRRRGIIHWQKIYVHTCYPFNFFQYKVELPIDHKLYVLPRPFPIHSLPLEIAPKSTYENNKEASDNKNTNDDFSTLREYVQGDNLRNIDWKATAKRNHLITKEFTELLPMSCYVVMCFSLDQYISEETKKLFELTIYSTASLVWNVCQRGVVEKFQIGDKVIEKGKGIPHAKKILRLLTEQTLQNIPISPTEKIKNPIIITNEISEDIEEYIEKQIGKVTIIYTKKPSYLLENTKQYHVNIKENSMKLEKLC